MAPSIMFLCLHFYLLFLPNTYVMKSLPRFQILLQHLILQKFYASSLYFLTSVRSLTQKASWPLFPWSYPNCFCWDWSCHQIQGILFNWQVQMLTLPTLLKGVCLLHTWAASHSSHSRDPCSMTSFKAKTSTTHRIPKLIPWAWYVSAERRRHMDTG